MHFEISLKKNLMLISENQKVDTSAVVEFRAGIRKKLETRIRKQ